MNPIAMHIKHETGKSICQYFMLYITLMYGESQESEIKRMLEIRDAYVMNCTATGTCHCLNIQTDLQSKPFCRYYSTTPAEAPNPSEREKIKKKQCIKVY